MVSEIKYRDIKLEEVYSDCAEMIVLGGEKVVPVLKFNGRTIGKRKNFDNLGDGNVGEVCKRLQLQVKEEINEGENIIGLEEYIKK